MTTRLQGKDTLFLPFNQGDGIAAPATRVNPAGYKTAYLWEEVWQRDSLLDILARFMHLESRRSRSSGKKVEPRER